MKYSMTCLRTTVFESKEYCLMVTVSPEEGWYDQDENEWVMVIEGQGVIEFEDGRVVTLSKGDYINIAAREKAQGCWYG